MMGFVDGHAESLCSRSVPHSPDAACTQHYFVRPVYAVVRIKALVHFHQMEMYNFRFAVPFRRARETQNAIGHAK